jgi:serine protease AprX
VKVNGQTIPLDDAAQIPAGLEGYVSVALELNLINAFFSLTQGPTDLQPVLHATFRPTQSVTRGEFAVIVSRTFPQYNALTQPAVNSTSGAGTTSTAGQAVKGELVQQVAAYPNPFSGTTTISYFLTKESPVSVEVYNVLGRKVQSLASGTEAAGLHQVQFDGSKLARGTYLFKVKTGETVATQRLVIQ